jgi:hypothetical protein
MEENEKKPTEAEKTAAPEPVKDTPEEVKAEEQPKAPAKPDEVDGDYNSKKGSAGDSANAYFKPIQYVNDGTRTIDEDIERIREIHTKKLNRSKIWDWASLGLMLLCFIAVLLVTFFNKDTNRAWLTWTVLGVAIAVIVASFIAAALSNKKSVKVAGEYLSVFQDAVNGYTLSKLGLENPTLSSEAKGDDQLIIQAHYFRVINSIQSRALVEAKRKDYDFVAFEAAVIVPQIAIETANKLPENFLTFDGTPFVPTAFDTTQTSTQELSSTDMTMLDINLASEVGGQKEAGKRSKDIQRAKKTAQEETMTSTGMFGKFYSYGMKVKSEEAFIIAFMGEKKNTYLPDYLTGYQALHVPGLRRNIIVYVTDTKTAMTLFDAEATKLLNEITPDITLQSAFISVNSYGSKAGLTLSDDVMTLPMKPLAHRGTFDSYKKATEQIFAFLDHIDEKRAK